MARTGLYKSEVKQARDALLAQGKHPSVDAVRIALDNTGSKTTIHKYLKELEADGDGTDGRKASISEALQDLVGRLASQLQDEADKRVDEVQASGAEKERQHAGALTTLHKEVEVLSAQLQWAETAKHQEAAAHDTTRETLQHETIARHTAEQQVSDLKERLSENEAHRQSLEEKHLHAREALEHYRQSVKEQRDQDQRRHEHQIQQLQAEMRQLQQSLVVKQDDVTRLNQEAVRLVTDLSHAQKALYDQQSFGRQLEQKLATLQPVEQCCALLEMQATEKNTYIEEQKSRLANASSQVNTLSIQVHALQLELATVQTKLGEQQTIASEWRTFIATNEEKAAKKMPVG